MIDQSLILIGINIGTVAFIFGIFYQAQKDALRRIKRIERKLGIDGDES